MKIKKQKKIKPSMIFSIAEPKEGDLCTLFYSRIKALQAYKQLLNIIVIHIPNEHITSKAYIMKLLRMGLVPGTADYWIGIRGGKSVFMEFKRNSKCKQSDNQKNFEIRVTDLGFPYILVWDVDIAIDILYFFNGNIERFTFEEIQDYLKSINHSSSSSLNRQ